MLIVKQNWVTGIMLKIVLDFKAMWKYNFWSTGILWGINSCDSLTRDWWRISLIRWSFDTRVKNSKCLSKSLWSIFKLLFKYVCLVFWSTLTYDILLNVLFRIRKYVQRWRWIVIGRRKFLLTVINQDRFQSNLIIFENLVKINSPTWWE